MTGNKTLLVFLSLALVASPHVYAQSAGAPALFAVEEVNVQPMHFGNDQLAKSCGLSQQELESTLTKALVEKGVPAFAAADAKPPSFNRARIDLIADIFSYNSEGLDCTSWVSLTAQSQGSVHVPPVDVARGVTIVYWHEGSLLSSAQSMHEGMVNDALQRLAAHFALQYKQDQPASPAQ